MSEMIAEVYRAFKQAGVSDDDAQAAAAALTGLRDEPWKRSIEKELAEIRGTLRLHNWMGATNIVLTVAVLFRLLSL